MVYDSQNKMHKKYFEYESIDDESMENIVRILAPVECEEISLAGALRKNISLFELLGVNSVEGLNLDSRWENSKIYETMAVPLGVNVKDEIVYLNLHENFMDRTDLWQEQRVLEKARFCRHLYLEQLHCFIHMRLDF